MPFIKINLLEGRTSEKKELLIKEVTETVANVLNAPKETIRILIQEVPYEHWGIAGQSVSVRRNKRRS